MKRRYFVRGAILSGGYTRWFVFDADSGLDVRGPLFILDRAQDEADKLNGAMWRQEEEAS